ncbi:MAG: hypothetical protein CVV13_08265 [Gammaproteobacteria bacterium HGW-Gammaproteobacteria-3]|nr:MAG: hypothetical protein CVV13_08265 [Gammaproteobacteria bacterium HGW-Gammaproteobacteria-3]
MKKLLLFTLAAFAVSGCAEKSQYEQAVLEQMQVDSDLKDYKLTPEDMTRCVVELSSGKMPGIFPLDPKRLEAYRNYSKMLTLNKAEHPEQVLEELRVAFGSPHALAEAHSIYTESVLNCVASLLAETGPENKEAEPTATPAS